MKIVNLILMNIYNKINNMKISKKEFENIILYFAKVVNKENSYIALIGNYPLSELIKMIIYDLFLIEYNSYFVLCTEIEHYDNLLECSKELEINGFVEFKN